MPASAHQPNFIATKGKCQGFFAYIYHELTVQQDEWPQPPPKPEKDGEKPLPADEELKADMFFLTSFEPQYEQAVSFSYAPTF